MVRRGDKNWKGGRGREGWSTVRKNGTKRKKTKKEGKRQGGGEGGWEGGKEREDGQEKKAQHSDKIQRRRAALTHNFHFPLKRTDLRQDKCKDNIYFFMKASTDL